VLLKSNIDLFYLEYGQFKGAVFGTKLGVDYKAFENDSLGAMISISLGFSESGKPADTLNGQDLSRFTEQDTKDSLVVMGAIAVGVIAISGTLRPRACFFEYPVPGFNLKTATCGAIQW
jgi:hypothetical protein